MMLPTVSVVEPGMEPISRAMVSVITIVSSSRWKS